MEIEELAGLGGDPTQAPDLQAATGVPLGGGPTDATLMRTIGGMGGSPPAGLMETIASGGRGPDPAMLALLQAVPSQGMSYAQALAGGVAAMRGQPNPVSQIMESQQRQNNVISAMLERMTERDRLAQRQAEQQRLARERLRLDEQAKKDEQQRFMRTQERMDNKDAITFLEGFKANPSPLAQLAYASGMARVSSKYGPALPPEFFMQQMKLDDKELDHLRASIEAGATDEQLLAQFPKIASVPKYLETERAILQNPTMRAKLGYKTDEELRALQYDAMTKKVQGWALENGFKVDSAEFRYANEAFRAANGGRSIYTADPKSAPDLMAITAARASGEQRALAQLEKKERMEAGIQREAADYNNKLAEARQASREASAEKRQGGKPLPGSWIDMLSGLLITPTQEEYTAGGGSKRYRNSNTMEENLLLRLNTVGHMSAQIKNLVNGLLVDNTPDNLVNALKGKGARALRNSAGWAQLDNLLTERNIELTGALGPGQFRTTLMTYLQDAGVKTRDTREVANIVGDAIDTSIHNRRMSIISGGNTAAMQAYQNPLVPKNPAIGWKLKDGNWVSESGKKMWKDGREVDIP